MLSMLAAIVVVGVFVYIARRIDRRHHQEKLELIQERIRRRQENPGESDVRVRGEAGGAIGSASIDSSSGADCGVGGGDC